MIRSVLAIVAGYVILAVLVIGATLLLGLALPGLSRFPPPMPLAPIQLGLVALVAVAAGYATAAIARRAPVWHGVALGALLLTLGLAFNRAEARGAGPTWYPFAVAALECAGAIAGGSLRGRGERRDVKPGGLGDFDGA